jgi:SAM-dependent methyltransferase
VAELYARARPSYPRELIEDVIRETGLCAGARVLELGAGPGTASVLFSGHGYPLVCLEPGPQLAAIARRRLAADANAQVVETTFEDWAGASESFDLVFAAQSFHWIDPAMRFAKAARALKPSGVLAVFANRPLRGRRPVDLEIAQAYAAHAPELGARGIDTNTRDNFLGLFAAAPEFRTAHCREYPWRTEYATSDYLDLLRTHSDHRLLASERLQSLLADIGRAIDADGGRVCVDYVTVLCWARRA